jgi:hypothetical protein
MRLTTQGKVRKLLLAAPIIVGATGTAAVATHITGTAGSTCSGTQHPGNPSGSVEAMLANLSPAAGSQVQPGSIISLLYTDETPIASSTSTLPSPTVTIDGKPITATVSPTSGVTPNYVRPSDGGSMGTQCQDEIDIQVPGTISGGNHTATITAYDSDNNLESFSWTFTTPSAPPPGVISSQSITPNDEGFVVNGEGAGGSMTFSLFRPSDKNCSHTPVFTQTVTVTNGVAETSNTSVILTKPGKYRWVITYSGDDTHAKATSPCGSEWLKFSNG